MDVLRIVLRGLHWIRPHRNCNCMESLLLLAAVWPWYPSRLWALCAAHALLHLAGGEILAIGRMLASSEIWTSLSWSICRLGRIHLWGSSDSLIVHILLHLSHMLSVWMWHLLSMPLYTWCLRSSVVGLGTVMTTVSRLMPLSNALLFFLVFVWAPMFSGTPSLVVRPLPDLAACPKGLIRTMLF